MEANAGLVAGSHIRNEIVVIRGDAVKPVSHLNSEIYNEICSLCGDGIGMTSDGELFVACNECPFSVCRNCYEYERKDGNKACPQCKTKYKRHRGSPRVEGDEDEDGVDDLESEFNVQETDERAYPQQMAEEMLHQRMRYGRGDRQIAFEKSDLPQITDGREGDSHAFDLPPGNHALVPSGAKRVHPLSITEVRTLVDPNKDPASYGFGSVAWKERLEDWKAKKNLVLATTGDDGNNDEPEIPAEHEGPPVMDESRQPLSRRIPIASSKINPYRMVIVIRLVALALFLRYRILNPVKEAYGLWLTSVICEIWFALSWIMDQFPKWFPINRETYLDRLALRFDSKDPEKSQLCPVDIFVSTVDPMKEPPIVTANTVLSILAVDYPVNKISCYVSDDGAAMLTFEGLVETSEFARQWVPFCKKYSIEPRAPDMYFAQKIDYLKDKVQPSFVKERRAMKREYEEFKVRMNALVAKAQKVPDEGWTMQDGTLWPGNNPRDHPGMIQVFLGQTGARDTDGKELPRLVYVSREKRPGFQHHKKAGAMNSLVRVSAVLTNAPYILNLDCDHYINNSKALREGMCFMMDPTVGPRVCYVQFPQRFDGIDKNDRYANHNTVFFDINLRGLDGIQGPVYVGTGCIFRRQALYGNEPPPKQGQKKKSKGLWGCCGPRKKKLKSKFKRSLHKKSESATSLPMSAFDGKEEGMEDYDEESANLTPSQIRLEKRFGHSAVFVDSTFGKVPDQSSSGLILKEAIHVISCGYEAKSEWGKEIGWIYGSVTEDILTGFKMHSRGWKSIYCMPTRPAFKGSAPINLSDRLHQVLRWALGSVEIMLSRHCPIWYGYRGGLKPLQRMAYINTIVYPLTSIPLIAYCVLPAVCLLTNKFIIPNISSFASIWFISLFVSIFATSLLEIGWSGVGIEEWWRNEQFWVIGGVSSHLFAVFQGLLKVLAGVDTNFTVTSKSAEDEDFAELYVFKWTTLLIPPTTLIIINLVGIVAGVSDAINNGYQSWGPLFGKIFFAFWVIVHLYPFLKGLMGRQNRTPTIVIVWSILLASIFSLLWVRIDPFLPKQKGPNLQQCGLTC